MAMKTTITITIEQQGLSANNVMVEVKLARQGGKPSELVKLHEELFVVAINTTIAKLSEIATMVIKQNDN